MRRVILFLTVFVLISSFMISACSAYTWYDDGYYYENDYEYEYEEEGYNSEFNIGKNVLIACVIGLVLSLIITGIMRSKMKSVRYERAARNYIKSGSMVVERSRDMYLYSHTTRMEKPKNNSKR